MTSPPSLLPPTSENLRVGSTRPYFLWWTDMTVACLHEALRDPVPEQRAYWMGALLREANSRDIWLFVRPAEVRELWPLLERHLGRTRDRWRWLLGMEAQRPPDDGG